MNLHYVEKNLREKTGYVREATKISAALMGALNGNSV